MKLRLVIALVVLAGFAAGLRADESHDTGPAWDQAGLMAGQGASEVSDSLSAASEALAHTKGPFDAGTAREMLTRTGQLSLDKSGALVDPITGRFVSRNELQKTVKSMNSFNAAQNQVKNRWQGTKDKLGKAGEVAGMMDKAGVYATGAGELASGDIVGGTSTLVNDRLSDSVKAGGAWAGSQAGMAVGGATFGPPGAVVGGVVGGAYGAWKGGKVYDQYGKPIVDAGLNKGAEIYYGDPRGADAQGRADINAEQANLTPEALDRLKQIERMKQVLTPQAFEVWKKIWNRPPPVFGPPSLDDLRDPGFQKALTQIKVGIYESNRDHPDGYGPSRIDPNGALAAAEKSVLDRIAQLEKDVEWEVGEQERARREWERQDELARLREEQELIAAERARRARDAAQAAQALDTFGAILGAMGQGMNQSPQQTQQSSTGSPSSESLPPGAHRRPDGTIHYGNQ